MGRGLGSSGGLVRGYFGGLRTRSWGHSGKVRKGTEPELLLGLERVVLKSALPGAEIIIFLNFLLLLFSRVQFGFYY